MRVLVRRSVPVILDGERKMLIVGDTPDLPDDIALALVRGMAASRILGEGDKGDASLVSPSAPTIASSQHVPAVASTPAKPSRPAKPSTRRVK
jgi:hypothetical protein